jgi:hypothetical protein
MIHPDIAIIGILAAILIPCLARCENTARFTVCWSDLRQTGFGL